MSSRVKCAKPSASKRCTNASNSSVRRAVAKLCRVIPEIVLKDYLQYRERMAVDRLLPTDEARDLIQLTREVADKVLTPIVDEHEKAETYPEGVFATLGEAGLLSLPYPEEWGGGAQPYEVYLQVLEEIAARWAAVAVAVSVHSLACHPLMAFGTDEQKQRWLPGMLSGEQIGAYSLSEPQAGSDAAALRCAARPDGDHYVLDGSKSWITHGGVADFYTLF